MMEFFRKEATIIEGGTNEKGVGEIGNEQGEKSGLESGHDEIVSEVSGLREKKQERQEKETELISLFKRRGFSINPEEIRKFINKKGRQEAFEIPIKNWSLFLDICEIENYREKLKKLEKEGLLPKNRKTNKRVKKMAPLPLEENRPLNELFENKKLLRLLKVPADNLKSARRFYGINDLTGIRSLAGKNKVVELLEVPAGNFNLVQRRCKIDSADGIEGLAKQEGIVQALKLPEKKFKLFLKLQEKSWDSKEEFEVICRENEEIIQSLGCLPYRSLEVAIQNQILTKENFRKIPDSLIARLDEFIDFQKINTVEEKEKIDILRSLVRYYRHFPLAADQTIKALLENKLDFIKDEKELFEIIDRLKFFSLNIFEKYKKISSRKDREKLIGRVKKMRKKIFQNRPLKIREENFVEAADLIKYCFNLEMDTKEIIESLSGIKDRTQDLKLKKDNPKSFEVNPLFSYSQEVELEQGTEIDSKKINFFQNVFRKSGQKRETLEMGREEDKRKIRQEIFSFLSRVARGDTIITKKDFLFESLEDLAVFFSIVRGQAMENLAKRRIESKNLSLVRTYLFEINDSLEKFENDFERALKTFLDENPDEKEKLKQILSKDKYKEKTLKLLGGLGLTDLDSEKIAKVLFLLSPQRIVKKLQIETNGELEKFKRVQRKTKETAEQRAEMKLVPCKNAASFFASFIEGSKRIDTSVFNNKNYFVFNLVDKTNEERFLKGSIQAHFIEVRAKRALLLREINFDSDLLYKTRTDSLTDETLKAVKAFANSNHLEEVYLPEQPVSPRKEICDYLNQYLFEEKRTFFFRCSTTKTTTKNFKNLQNIIHKCKKLIF